MTGKPFVRAALVRPLQLAVLLCALLTGSPAPSAEPGWRKLEAAHFSVLSQLGERETHAWAREFNQFIASMSGVLRIDPRQLPPLTVVLFARDRDFQPFMAARPNGKTANLAGLTARQSTWSVIAIGQGLDQDREQRRSTVYHEAAHWMMSGDEARRPAWYVEGMAVLLSTFEYDGKKIIWGTPPASGLQTLDQQGLMRMREFLARPDSLFNHDDDTAQFYEQSWAFTHFLLYSGDPARVQLLRRFLEVYRTHSGEATVDAVIGDKLAAIEKDFRNYASRQAYDYSSTNAASLADPPLPVVAEPAYVQATLGFLAFGTDHFDLAHQYASKALELDPATPGGHEILAYLAARDRSHDAVSIHAQAALQYGSRDSQMYMLLASTFADGPTSQPDALRQRSDLYARAIKLNPWRKEPYERLAEALLTLSDPTATDAQLLAQGLTIFPGNDWIRAGAAMVAERQDLKP